MDNKLKTWPERIWLQHSEDGYPVPHYKVETDEITWCEDKQYDSDVEYVRADLLSQQVEAANAARPVVREIDAERQRQVSAEGWTTEHDDAHGDRSLAQASACYVAHYVGRSWLLEYEGGLLKYKSENAPFEWPDSWCTTWWKPKNPRRDLIRAAALLVAEIERIDRATAPDSTLSSSPAQAEQPDSTLTDEQITAGAAILCDCQKPKPIGRNAAIDVFEAMRVHAVASTANAEQKGK